MMKKLIYPLVGILMISTVLVSCTCGTTGQNNPSTSDSLCAPEDSLSVQLPINAWMWQDGRQVLVTSANFLNEDQIKQADFLAVYRNGKLGKVPLGTLNQLPYEPALCPTGDIPRPKWFNGINRIFSACPQVNVGIGTSLPAQKLDVRGTTVSSRLLVGPSGTSANGSLVKFFVQNNTSDILQLGKATSAGSGDVLFKVTNDGTVYSKEIWVRPTDEFPDYVFEKGYQLKTLEAVEHYIDQYKHLPEMPSADAVEAGGLNVASTQVLLVKKIEELTLYLISLNHELEDLQNVVVHLKSVK